MKMCDAIVRTAGMENLQSLTEMIRPCNQQGNSRDCRPKFVELAKQAIWAGNEDFHAFEKGLLEPASQVIFTPFIHDSKADIAYRALELGVPLHWTWSCYKGGDKHCGRCGTCVERLEAIDEAGKRAIAVGLEVEGQRIDEDTLVDRTEYEDKDYWREAVKHA